MFLLVFVSITDPNKIALPLLIGPFLLVGYILYQITSLILSLITPTATAVFLKIFPLSVSFLGVVLLLLRSLGQLTWRDSLLTVIFVVLLWLYVWRADFLQK